MKSVQSDLETCHSKLALESGPFMFSFFRQLNTASFILQVSQNPHWIPIAWCLLWNGEG